MDALRTGTMVLGWRNGEGTTSEDVVLFDLYIAYSAGSHAMYKEACEAPHNKY